LKREGVMASSLGDSGTLSNAANARVGLSDGSMPFVFPAS
jgi:hypothetical protein